MVKLGSADGEGGQTCPIYWLFKKIYRLLVIFERVKV